MKLKIDVTQEDIDQGNRMQPHGCMIHRAFMRTTGDEYEPEDIFVGGIGSKNTAYLGFGPMEAKDGYAWKAKLPLKAWRSASNFDNGIDVKPFSFEIELPDELLTGSGV